MKSKDYNEIVWQDIVICDLDSPSGLTWRSNGKYSGWKNYKRNGKPNGWRLEYKSKAYYCHRIIAILSLNLRDNSLVVNHKDCNPFNNSIDNLEICTAVENSRRQKCHVGIGLHPTNTSGFVGVSEHITDNAYYARAQFTDLNGKIVSKYFPYKTHGSERAIELAVKWRRDSILQLNLEGAGYATEG